MASPASVEILAFGEFQANLRSRELWRNGVKVRLPDQSFQVLTMLLEHPGELVTREEIRQRLWPGDTFVDFDHGVNNAVNRLREALGDSAESPRLVETLPRRGYRFIGGLDIQQGCAPATESAVASGLRSGPRSAEVRKRDWRRLSYSWIALGVAAILLASPATMKFLAGRGRRSAPIRSLAVLPLENLSGDASQEYFADGMTDALITNLASIGSLRVISRTSVMAYKGARKPLAEIARELNVDAVVEGSVVRSGNRVRINAQLIQAMPERHLWANAYERDQADIVALQGDVARAIATEIQIKLTPQEQAHLAANRLVNPDAYNASLLGRYFLERAGKDNLEKALGYYEQAIQLDPNYAIAWAGLADVHRFLAGGGYVLAEEGARTSRAAVERAIELDADLAEAHAANGSIQTFVDWNWTAAGASFERALALEPGNISALRGAAWLAAVLGRYDEALQLARQAVERDPLNPRSHRLLGNIARFAGRLDEALAALNKALQLNPEGPYTHHSIGCVYLARTRGQEALAEMKQEKEPAFRLLGLAMAYHALGRKKESGAALTELIENYGDTAGFQVAEAYGFRGESDRAFEWLERAYIQRDGALVGMKADPLLKNLEHDPRYGAFLKKMRLSAESLPVLASEKRQ